MKSLLTVGNALLSAERMERRGEIVKVTGILAESLGPQVPVGSPVSIQSAHGSVQCQVVGFRDSRILLMALETLEGVAPGDPVIGGGEGLNVPVSNSLLGRVVDGNGLPIDGKGPIDSSFFRPLRRDAPSPITRRRIDTVLDVGVRAIDTTLTIGVGQRVGIMAGSGVGKSTLLGMIARGSSSDTNVIGLIGERGREVREFIEKDLGEEGLRRSVIVVATSDKSALLRIRAALLATTYAEYFRELGQNVVLMMDSVTRLAMAQREVGLAIGEPPSTKGYTPSTFSLLPRVLERAGLDEGGGSITGLYTVLVEGDDMNEPIADAVRGILDGHIVLDRKLAAKNHYPAIQILESVSRVMPDIASASEIQLANFIREVLAVYRENEDLISIGAYERGSNALIDTCVNLIDPVNLFLRQRPDEIVARKEGLEQLVALVNSRVG